MIETYPANVKKFLHSCNYFFVRKSKKSILVAVKRHEILTKSMHKVWSFEESLQVDNEAKKA